MVFPNSRAGCSRVPPQSATLTQEYCYPRDPVRLACLIHATSVRSEPESNSQEKKLRFFPVQVASSSSRAELASPSNWNFSLELSFSSSHKHLLFHVSSRDTSQASVFNERCPPKGEQGDSISKLTLPAQGGVLKNFYPWKRSAKQNPQSARTRVSFFCVV